MEQIKFRGILSDAVHAAYWVYGYLVSGGLFGDAPEKCWIFYDGKFNEVVPESVGQFTGLRDKNGNEIYKGDIVTYNNRLYEVAINFNGYYLQRYKLWNGQFRPSFKYAMSLITKPSSILDRGENGGIVDSAEVIGNKYQNPELILTDHEK